MAGQTFGEGFFGDAEGLLALGHVVEDLEEVTNSVHHLVVLGDDVGEEELGLVLIAGLDVGGVGVVSQTAGFTHLLEHDGVHATAVVFVEEGHQSGFVGIKWALVVVDHTKVDVLGIVRSDENLVLVGGLQFVVLALGHGLKFSFGLVVLSDNSSHFFGSHRTIIQNGMLIVLEVFQEIEKLFRVNLTQLVDGDLVELRVVLARDTVIVQGTEVFSLIRLGVEA